MCRCAPWRGWWLHQQPSVDVQPESAWKCCERCAAYPLHQSTQFKGQRTLMNIWCQRSSSASDCCSDFFVPPILEMWPNRCILTFLQIALFLSVLSQKSKDMSQKRGQKKKDKLTFRLNNCFVKWRGISGRVGGVRGNVLLNFNRACVLIHRHQQHPVQTTL